MDQQRFFGTVGDQDYARARTHSPYQLPRDPDDPNPEVRFELVDQVPFWMLLRRDYNVSRQEWQAMPWWEQAAWVREINRGSGQNEDELVDGEQIAPPDFGLPIITDE